MFSPQADVSKNDYFCNCVLCSHYCEKFVVILQLCFKDYILFGLSVNLNEPPQNQKNME